MINTQHGFYGDFRELGSLKQKSKEPSSEDIMETAKQLEGIFINEMLKSMRSANKPLMSEMTSQSNERFFEEMFDTQISQELSDRGFGLAPVIARQLEKVQDGAPKPLDMTEVKGFKGDFKLSRPDHVDFLNPEDFISQIYGSARRAAKDLGVNPKVLLSQSALETGWGAHIIRDEDGKSSFNLFNIKAKDDEPSVMKTTLEFEDGKYVKKQEPFKRYESFKESFADYVQLIKSRYLPDNGAVSANEFANTLQEKGYATDPKYASKIMQIMLGDTLNQSFRKIK